MINSLGDPFVQNIGFSKTVSARELKFLENVRPQHVSHVMLPLDIQLQVYNTMEICKVSLIYFAD